MAAEPGRAPLLRTSICALAHDQGSLYIARQALLQREALTSRRRAGDGVCRDLPGATLRGAVIASAHADQIVASLPPRWVFEGRAR